MSADVTSPVGAYAVGARYPDRIAIVAPDGGTTSFGQLLERGNRLSNALRALGLGDGDVVAFLLGNEPSFFEVALGVEQVGMYRVPINTHSTPAEVAYIVRDSGARVLVASHDLAAVLGPVLDDLGAHRIAIGGAVAGWHDYDAWLAAADAGVPADRRAGAAMGYTSGTTGRPKGVRRPLAGIPPEGLLSVMLDVVLSPFGFRPLDGVHLVVAPLYHAAPNTFAVGALHLGHTVVVQPRFDAEAFLTTVAERQVTSTHLVPTHFHRLLELPKEVRAAADLSSLEIVVAAGAPFPPKMKARALGWLGPVIWEYLASTEGLVSVISPTEALAHPGSVGRPTDVRILDDEGDPVVPGDEGLIYFPAGQPPFAYHNDPGKTAATVRADGYATAGDLGRIGEGGYLYLLDRRVDLIITGGVNVYPAEIEQRLVEHPMVEDVAVVGLPDAEWGQQVVAVVKLADGEHGHEQVSGELDAYCRASLTRAKCPRRYEFVDTLPRTETGKLLRRVVRDTVRSPNDRPDPSRAMPANHG
ncbi:MAG: fadD [Amycolatopsis sp.]|uniref:AMP-binding protein n=1 Tax=Amycolatopsis sp. TaxID=37632 RepID=UPI00260976A6|nr:AMP-binding protein [Amycolatopsis sp.]MCU1682797.1 fadD [Amycolatopsis sp.]